MRSYLLIFVSLLAVLVAFQAETLQAKEDGTTVVPFSADNLQWTPSEAPFAPGAFGVVLSGDLTKPGPFTLRFKCPPGYTVDPHWHSNSECVTILEGSLSITPGTTIDPAAQDYLGAGSFFLVEGRKPHYAVVGDEWTILQITGEGPFDIHFVNPDGSEIEQP